MPLVDELVFTSKSHSPEYTHDRAQKCDWSIIFNEPIRCELENKKLSPVEQYKYFQEKLEKSKRLLDETQMLGIENFLQNRVSLIQVGIDFLLYDDQGSIWVSRVNEGLVFLEPVQFKRWIISEYQTSLCCYIKQIKLAGTHVNRSSLLLDLVAFTLQKY